MIEISGIILEVFCNLLAQIGNKMRHFEYQSHFIAELFSCQFRPFKNVTKQRSEICYICLNLGKNKTKKQKNRKFISQTIH